MSKYTPGEWTLKVFEPYYGVRAGIFFTDPRTGKQHMLAQLSPQNYYSNPHSPDEAGNNSWELPWLENVRLMAAAPEMLEALKECESALRRQKYFSDDWPPECERAMRVIAKAEGLPASSAGVAGEAAGSGTSPGEPGTVPVFPGPAAN